ncbi:MAG: ATP-dependent DNA helicase [Candidatus Electrothrix sp. YB6]
MNDIFTASGILAANLPEYEVRQGQQEMAHAVAALLAEEGGYEDSDQDQPRAHCLLVEAGTGLGKTLAYLIPAVLSDRKVVVSTNTRHLQDQILQKEIPFIRQHIAPDLTAMCVKGRQNYLCLYRWHQLTAHGQQNIFAGADADGQKKKKNPVRFNDLNSWLKKTAFADRAELPGLAGNSALWQKVCCLPHFCLGSECPDGGNCYLTRLRRAAASCQLLVVNHHLLFSDLAVRKSGFGEVLPRYQSVIFDEAHHVENVASNFFGFSFSRYQVIDLIADIDQSAREKGAGNKQTAKILSAAGTLSGLNEHFAALFPMQKGRFPLAGLLEENPELDKAKEALLAGLCALADQLDRATGQDEPWGNFRQRCLDLAGRLEQITGQPPDAAEAAEKTGPEEPQYVRWLERTEKNLTLSATPVDIADDLRTTLFANVEHCVFASATLQTDAGFSYFSKRLGLPEETATCAFSSPFNYPERTLLYVPGDEFPEPNNPACSNALHQEIRQLITCSRGRALVLFTSFRAMELAWHSLRDDSPYPMLRQGSGSRYHLLTRFAEEKESVLFAVASFWEGVDIPGDSLSLVIMDKLPFEVPSDPVIMARMDKIKSAGGNPFMEFQLPRAVLTLRQGAGRLMRRAEDRGVIAILDVRLFSKFYGRRFLASLPPSPVSRKMQEVQRFFADGEAR